MLFKQSIVSLSRAVALISICVLMCSAASEGAVQIPGILTKLDSTQAENLKGLLNAKLSDDEWGKAVLSTYFDSLYDPSFVDLIVFIKSDSTVRIGLFKGNEMTDDLQGVKDVWVLIFSELNLKGKQDDSLETTKVTIIESEGARALLGDKSLKSPFKAIERQPKKPEASVEIKLEALDASKGPGEASFGGLVRTVGKVLGFAAGDEKQSAGLKDSVLMVNLEPVEVVSEEQKKPKVSLYVGMKKFPLAIGTLNRISIDPKAVNKIRGIHYTFTNSDESRLGASIGLGGTFRFHTTSFQYDSASSSYKEIRKPDQDDFRIVPYIFGHLYLKRPRAHVRSIGFYHRLSFSVFLGTNLIKEDFLDHIVFGLSLGNVIGSVGVVVGGNWVDTEQLKRDGNVKKTRDSFWFVGLDYKL